MTAVNSTVVEEIVKKETAPIYAEVVKIKEMLAKDPWLLMPEPLRPYIGVLILIALVMSIVASVACLVLLGRRPKEEKNEESGDIEAEKLIRTLEYWRQKDLEKLRKEVEEMKKRLKE